MPYHLVSVASHTQATTSPAHSLLYGFKMIALVDGLRASSCSCAPRASLRSKADAVANPQMIDAGSQLDDHPYCFTPWNPGQSERVVHPGADLAVVKVNADCGLANADFTGTGLCHFDILSNENLRPSKGSNHDGLSHQSLGSGLAVFPPPSCSRR